MSGVLSVAESFWISLLLLLAELMSEKLLFETVFRHTSYCDWKTKSLYSGSLFFLDIFLLCCQSFITGAITIFVKILHLCQSDKPWQMKKKWIFAWFMFIYALHCNTFQSLFIPKWTGTRSEKQINSLSSSVSSFLMENRFRILSFDLFPCNRESSAAAIYTVPPAGMALNCSFSCLPSNQCWRLSGKICRKIRSAMLARLTQPVCVWITVFSGL